VKTISAEQVTTGYHPRGYRIDKTASPINRYTQWEIDSNNNWLKPKPVCFQALPADGWVPVERFDWDAVENK